MKTTNILNSRVAHKVILYVRLAFLSGAGTAFIGHSAIAQNQPETAGENSGKLYTYSSPNDYHYLSTLTSGKCYKYNITTFVTDVLPANTVQFSDNSASQMNYSAITLHEYSDDLSAQAKSLRMQASKASDRQQAKQFSQQADAMDALSASKQLEATVTSINSAESQYEANLQAIVNWQRTASYGTDVLTSANLLSHDADFYYAKALGEIEKANASTQVYVKQGYMDEAQNDMFTAALKQQGAENIYISFKNSASVEVAMRVDSMLTTPDMAARENSGKIIFCVQVGSFSGVVPMDKANKLMKIAGLGITRHKEVNGVTTFTIGEYTNSTSADLLSEELTEAGFKDSQIVAYTGKGKDAKAFEGLAVK